VKGLDEFRKHFQGFEAHYRIIGGTACEVYISEAHFVARATKDIDLLIVLENYDEPFNTRLWEFIRNAGYKSLAKDMSEQKFYRFENPTDRRFPVKLELLCRDPHIILLPEGTNISPVSLNDDFSHLSAMVMDDVYYQFVIAHSTVIEGVHIANIESLICLKALAFQNLWKSREAGNKINSDDIKKHKYDVYRLSALLTTDSIVVPVAIRDSLRSFIAMTVKDETNINKVLQNMRVDNLRYSDAVAALRAKFSL
jgi:hypothetical protein